MSTGAVERETAHWDSAAPLLFAWEHLAALLPLEDLTQLAQERHILPAVALPPDGEELHSESYDVAARTLYRTHRGNVLLTGRKGVGKTTFVRELARRAATGEIPFLSGQRFVWLDCRNVGPEDSRACLESIFTAVTTTPDVILCLDGLAALLKRTHAGTNKPLLRAMLGFTTKGTKVTKQGRGQVGEPGAVRGGLRLIGVMSDWDYADLIGGDADMLDLFTRIEIEEPNEETGLAIARQHAGELSREFGLEIDDHVVARAVTLASTFILNECHPAKSINLLRQVCEDADFERTQAEGGNGAREPRAVRVEDVVRAVAEKTGIPAETIAGEQRECDFEAALRDAVVGQEQAIREVANELRLIKSGLTEPDKPAAVLLFAGMTGVGKTELAKRLQKAGGTRENRCRRPGVMHSGRRVHGIRST